MVERLSEYKVHHSAPFLQTYSVQRYKPQCAAFWADKRHRMTRSLMTSYWQRHHLGGSGYCGRCRSCRRCSRIGIHFHCSFLFSPKRSRRLTKPAGASRFQELPVDSCFQSWPILCSATSKTLLLWRPLTLVRPMVSPSVCEKLYLIR